MNHILRLQAENQALLNRLADIQREVVQFRKHLESEKFQGVEVNGIKLICDTCGADVFRDDRKDWIAIADVNRWLDGIASLCS